MIDKLIQKLNEATLFSEPFKHLSIEDFFPEDYYLEMMKNFPSQDKKYMKPLSKMYQKRFVLDLDTKEGNSITKLSPQEKSELEFWMEFRKQILSKDLCEAFLAKQEVPKKFWKNAYPTAGS